MAVVNTINLSTCAPLSPPLSAFYEHSLLGTNFNPGNRGLIGNESNHYGLYGAIGKLNNAPATVIWCDTLDILMYFRSWENHYIHVTQK